MYVRLRAATSAHERRSAFTRWSYSHRRRRRGRDEEKRSKRKSRRRRKEMSKRGLPGLAGRYRPVRAKP